MAVHYPCVLLCCLAAFVCVVSVIYTEYSSAAYTSLALSHDLILVSRIRPQKPPPINMTPFYERRRLRRADISHQLNLDVLWPCFNGTEATSRPCRRLHVIQPLDAGLGNHIFTYAVTLGLARRHNLIPVLQEHSPLFSVFKVSAKTIASRQTSKGWGGFREKCPHYFDNRTLSFDTTKDVRFMGYAQVWHYFADPLVQQVIRREYVFKDRILSRAKDFIDQIKQNYSSNTALHLVGIHIRRRDMKYRVKNYTKYGGQYLNQATTYFRIKYPTGVVFVVCSDDLVWARKALQDVGSPVVYSEGRPGPVDLAILSLCPDTVMTVGSYGYWGAWLAGGDTLYFGGNSTLTCNAMNSTSAYNMHEYFPPHWKRVKFE